MIVVLVCAVILFFSLPLVVWILNDDPYTGPPLCMDIECFDDSEHAPH